MDLGLRDKVAVVAAASQGLGKAVALGLAQEGARVAICARREDELRAAAQEIEEQTSAEVLAIRADVTSERDIQRLVDETLARCHRIDILVCNAGGPPAGQFDDFSSDQWRTALELNLMSTINLCRTVVPLMQKQRWGRVIAITSIAAKQVTLGLILSNTTRPGVLGFCKVLSCAVAADNVTVNCVCPGPIRTDRVQQVTNTMAEREGLPVEVVYQRCWGSIPMQRLGEPRELADLVVFLASERASYITGTAIQVDGGMIQGLF
jgi:3-oxoacyl-[acyl-carrier protein] reductase